MIVEVTKDNVKITEMSTVHQGDLNVNRCEFLLDDCFNGLNVTACFNGIPVPIINNMCFIPSLKEGNVTLGVYGYEQTDEALTLMYSPRPARFYVEKGSFVPEETECISELSNCETVLNSFKAQILEQMDKEIGVKSVIFNDISIYDIPTGVYFVQPGSTVFSGEDKMVGGVLMICQYETHARWFFFGVMNSEFGGWEGLTHTISDGTVMSVTYPMGKNA